MTGHTFIGHVDVISHTLIAGWAADPARPTATVPLTLTVNGSVTEIEAGRLRNDLKSLFENATGQYGFRFGEGPLPLSPFVENQVEICFAANGQPVAGGRACLPPLGTPQPASARAGQRTPILVSTTGRAGSSLLMARLARHPDILVGRQHPYELKLLGYHALALNTLVSKADRERSTNPDNMLAVPRFFVGFNPFNDENECRDPNLKAFWDETSPDILRSAFAAVIDAYYDRVAQNAGRPRAKFFAEKAGTSELARQATAFMFGDVNEIMLVRDPRDVICSAKSFWNRSVDKSIAALRTGFEKLARLRDSSRLRQLVLRYEDLVLRPEDAMRNVCAFLGIEYAPSLSDAAEENRIFESHGTSRSPQESVGRWRVDLPPQSVALVNREFSAYLRRFGYSDA